MNYQKFNTILMRVIAVLLMLVLLSTAAVTGRFARYISSSTGSDSARVAKFNVDYTLTPVEGKNGEFTLQVTNKSEVAVEYSVRVVFDNELSDGNLEVKINDTTGTFSDDKKTFTFGKIGELAPNTVGAAVPMTITLKNHKLITGGETKIEGLSTNKAFNFTVAVTATQID